MYSEMVKQIKGWRQQQLPPTLRTHLILYVLMNNVKSDLGIKLMFLDPSEVLIFQELRKKYSDDEAFNMILNGYKPQPFSNMAIGNKVRP